MYICPTCCKEFEKEEVLVKHFLKCWKDKNPNHQSKSAPRSEDINKYRCLDNRMAAHKFNKGDAFRKIVKPLFLQQIFVVQNYSKKSLIAFYIFVCRLMA